jgi:formimidoylglutamate deiminase
VGSDSNVARDVAAELRLLEYTQRLTLHRRNVRTDGPGDSNGARLFADALAGGAQASGRALGRLAPGCRADVVVLDARAMALPADEPDFVLDAFVFGHHPGAVRDVFVGGVQVIDDGHHPAEEEAAALFREAVGALRRAA